MPDPGIPSDEISTLQSVPRLDGPPGRREVVPALTIIHHPDLRRVGQRALLSSRSVSLSRRELSFAAPFAIRGGVLDDPYLSRRAVTISRRAGGLEITIPKGAKVRVDGAPETAGTVRLTSDQLDASDVVLVLANRVALLVHRVWLGPPPAALSLVGHSEGIDGVRRAIEQVADLDVSVLVTGDSGVGKEHVAAAIHEASGRRGPLVSMNMATLSPTTAASVLFGHVRGAFTGADRDHAGLFERAKGGTLFLDEVGEMPFDVQAMLLRVLETKEVLPLGASAERAVDVRLVAASDSDFDARTREGTFRSALFHRLSGFIIEVPSLAERREDVPRLLLHFLERELERVGELSRLDRDDPRTPAPLELSLTLMLLRFGWPGNVRQLQNVVQQLVISSRGQPTLSAEGRLVELLSRRGEGAEEPPRGEPDPDHLVAVLAEHGWEMAKAARALGMARTTLHRRIQEHIGVPQAAELDRVTVEGALRAHGDLGAVAAALRVSRRSLRARMRQLGLMG